MGDFVMASIINAGQTALTVTPDTTGALALQANGTTAVTINNSQNVGIGTSSPTAKLHVYGGSNNQFKVESNGAEANFTLAGTSYGQINNSVGDWYLTNDASANMIFRTASTERMRIASSGDVLIGGTTTIGDNGILLANADYTATYRNTGTAGAYIHAFASDNGGTRIVKYAIYANGTAGAVSDQNLKKNIEPARNYLDDLMNIEVVKYNWISDEENTPKELGCIAQQVETVFPGMVDEQTYKDGNGEEITQKMLKKEVFIPMMLKAIQELKTELNSVKTELDATKQRITELENKS